MRRAHTGANTKDSSEREEARSTVKRRNATSNRSELSRDRPDPDAERHGLRHLQRTLGNQALQRLATERRAQESRGGKPDGSATSRVDGNEIPASVRDVLESPGKPLDTRTRSAMGERFGYDFSGVRVHTDLRAVKSARVVDAVAYTVGSDVVFGSRQFSPTTGEGLRLLAHELTHVIQQENGGNGFPDPEQSLRFDEANSSREREAEERALAVAAGTAVPAVSQSVATPLIQRQRYPPGISIAPREDPIWTSKTEESERAMTDYMDARDYVREFYDNLRTFILLQARAESTAIQNFSQYSAVEDPPDLADEVMLSLFQMTFGGFQGWTLVRKGITRGVFAANLGRLQRGLGERIGTRGMEVLRRAGPTEREAMLGEQLQSLLQESVAAGRRLGGLQTETGRTAEVAVGARMESLTDWGTYVALAAQEEEIAFSDLQAKWETGYPWRRRLLDHVRYSLGPKPDVQSAAMAVGEAAQRLELELYRQRFGGNSGAELIITRGRMGVYSRIIRGGGWRRAVQRRISSLTGRDNMELARWLGIPIREHEVRESGRML